MIYLEHKLVMEITEIKDNRPTWEVVDLTCSLNEDEISYDRYCDIFSKVKYHGTQFTTEQRDNPDEDMIGYQKVVKNGIVCPGYYIDKNGVIKPDDE